jgi:serine/threonine protein kinase
MLEKLGEGSYSQCFKVQVSGTDQFYAMKVIPKAKLKETQR